MAATDKDKSKSTGGPPADLMPIIRRSGVLTDRQFADVRAKVLSGDLPFDPVALARRLVEENILTEYQAKRFLNSKSHGMTVGKYVILDRLGSGSMGRVYRAQHQLMGRQVALKIIAPEIASNARVVARFQREMRLVGRLDHPNVVRAFDADQVGEVLYIIMEYVSGQSLSQRFKTRGIMTPAEVVDCATQAALGLTHAHAQGIVHRDIKPSNLFLSDDGQIKILDLGLAALMEADEQATFATADGIAVGTIDYMSPEQAGGHDIDGRSDLFSLGCAMYHLSTGRVPYPGESPIERLGKRINNPPTPLLEAKPDLPPAFVRVMDKLLAHQPRDRFQSAGEAAEALQSLQRKPTPASPIARPAARTEPAPSQAPAEAAGSSFESEPSVVTVRPYLPAWFAPLADLAENSPGGALATVLSILGAVFLAGLVLGWLFL